MSLTEIAVSRSVIHHTMELEANLESLNPRALFTMNEKKKKKK